MPSSSSSAPVHVHKHASHEQAEDHRPSEPGDRLGVEPCGGQEVSDYGGCRGPMENSRGSRHGSYSGEHGWHDVSNAAAPCAVVRHEGASVPGPGASPSVPMSNYAFFVKYTYSNECALLAYNFHELVTQLGILELFTYRHDPRLISVTLAYIFYRYQVHHCDMALDLAVTLVYLEDVRHQANTELFENRRDSFNLICYFAFLAHAFNADRTIRLSDWYREIGWRSFQNCQQLNGYVFFLFSKVRQFRLRVSETRVKRYIQKLCSVPSQIHNGT
uniref:Uncharacterized protein n=1 Tax=Noctiluca scintillans TaxID=2966 RepID=A0A7S1A2F6_NOCSC|mmetsp:Transcript_29122/g.76923  ORF Transcript_29122/g.76923 Transcript_29122/m.76923 type:complete len:274 (+) Transcript_29122:77-898(+)